MVTVKLQRQSRQRDRQWWRPDRSWSVHWDIPGGGNGGIPTKPGHRGRVYGSAVSVSARAAVDGTWPAEAAAAITARLARDRSRYGYADRRLDLAAAVDRG